MHKKRILIVDDEPAFIRLLKINLERTGNYEVREENDPTRAVEAAGEFKPDLILLDLIMPKLHGSAVADAVKSSPVLSQTPIVFLTASAWKSGAQPNRQIAGCPVIAKPASMVEVIEAIEDNLPASPDRLPPNQEAPPKLHSRSWFGRVRQIVGAFRPWSRSTKPRNLRPFVTRAELLSGPEAVAAKPRR